MKSERLFQIVYLLQAHGSLKVREIAECLEASERTIRRDIDALMRCGVPLRTERGRSGGVSLMPGTHLAGAIFTPQEREQLLLGTRAMVALGSGSAARIALAKLEGAFAGDVARTSEVNLGACGPVGEDSPWIDCLRSAICEQRRLRLRLLPVGAPHDADDEGLVVEPERLVNDGSTWHLEAARADGRGPVRLCLEHISEVTEVGASRPWSRESDL